MLALEGELTPILMQMVKSANTDGLLNDYYNARQFQNELKSYLHSALQVFFTVYLNITFKRLIEILHQKIIKI